MVVLTTPSLDQIPLLKSAKQIPHISYVPTIDLSKPEPALSIINACKSFGFFKVTHHGVDMELVERLEDGAREFFSLAQSKKEGWAAAKAPMGYGNKCIGLNGDMGWLEYLLFAIKNSAVDQVSMPGFEVSSRMFCSALNEYITAMRDLASQILQQIANGLQIQTEDVFSSLIENEESDQILRLNHYPPCPRLKSGVTGFGEHTDPQLISILRSNSVGGLQFALKDGRWVSAPPDPNSFFVIVGDSLQVLTNGRFKSVKHRVVAPEHSSRLSMIFFAGPPLSQRITPLPELMQEGEESMYREFTWGEYKKAAYKTRLADYRLGHFEKATYNQIMNRDCSLQ
ncbi:Gibberellin 2-beta-dioxygenase [Rhynchospora pubera]|uniref:gibberellin 2beta-dioxygenase n=1 Tax=Rhynchospora pubera TaxID=906938 RepID=A0AAV8HVK4_9POAL|nr:Gibberellin 2-beta-dioxygenase [Rhynchospora pubera]KAJ4821579.1 Gibberellin 2-beta-dioxygenase [Rhynchospora pubera]